MLWGCCSVRVVFMFEWCFLVMLVLVVVDGGSGLILVCVRFYLREWHHI